MSKQINPFHILSGQVVFTKNATYHFSDPGNWFVDGQPVSQRLHRTDGPAVEWIHGDREWFHYGQRHRTDGPAEEYADGSRIWWRYGQLHRLDGPAAEWASGNKAWYVNGQQLFEDQFIRLVQNY